METLETHASTRAPLDMDLSRFWPWNINYRTVNINGLDFLYRETGPKDAPVILLPHGFPTSSYTYRNLIPALADEYRSVAADYPGFRNSSMPTVDEFG